ncbi:MAG: MmgE/PrpD family protein [Chloroflexi bacterium]|nr:MmgE/PrpD family protein [Chloroflexota bacterium]
MGPTEHIVNWIVSTGYDQMPAEAKMVAQETCFDCLGTLLAGSAQPIGITITSYVQDWGGKGESTIIPGGQLVPAGNAAFANGTLAHALDYDDWSSAFSHSASILFPALLALAEKTGSSGRDVVEAYITGHEVGWAVRPPGHDDQPFHRMGVCGRIGAAAACAKLLKLAPGQVTMALGIAGSMASGLGHNIGSMTKPLHAGLAARDGVMAAELASRGWTAGEHILEHPSGFIEAFFGAGDNARALVERVGNPYRIHNMVKFKKYPCGGANHYTIDALLELMREHHFDYRDVEEVEVEQGYYSMYIDPLYLRKPKDRFGAEFSMVYNAAATLVLGKVDIDAFSEERIKDPRIQQTMDRIRIRVLSKWEVSYARDERQWPAGSPGFTGKPVLVRLKDGRTLSKAIPTDRILGAPKNPWGFENLRSKFETNARLALPGSKVAEAVRVWSRLEQIVSIRQAIKHVVA